MNEKLKEVQSSFIMKINENEECFKKETNSLKELLENKINTKLDELHKRNTDKNEIIVNNNNNDEIKRKREFNVMKKDLKDLNEKFNDFEREFDNKLDFIETSLSKILEFIEIINDTIIKKYKKNLLYRIKTIELVYKMNNIFNLKENKNDNKEEKENEDNKDNKENKNNIDKKEDIIPKEENKNIKIIKRIIYNKKRGYKINKKSSLENKNKSYNDQINKFRLELIKFSINSIHKK